MPLECERWQWRELMASEHGPPDPSTRLVLFVLALHMNDLGDRCFPSQELIAKRTGLSDRSVRKHLKAAQKLGWIAVYLKRRQGQAWFNHEYGATIPDNLAQFCTSKPWEKDPNWKRAANSAGRSGQKDEQAESGARHPEAGARHPEVNDTTGGNLRHDARHQLPTNTSMNSSGNPSINTPDNVLAARRVGDFANEKPKEPPEPAKTPDQIEAEQAAKRKAAEEAEHRAIEAKKKAAEERANRIKVALKAFPDYTESDLAKVARVTLVEVQQARRHA